MSAGEPSPKLYSDAEVDRIVAKRLAEREQGVVVAELKKELDGIRKEIGNANHLKRTFGKQLSDLNALIRAHVAQPMHAGTAEKFTELERNFDEAEAQFGLDNLTPEERAAFPTVVRTVLAQQQRINDQKQADKEAAESDSRHWQEVSAEVMVKGHRVTVISLLVAGLATLSTILGQFGVFSAIRVHFFHLPS